MLRKKHDLECMTWAAPPKKSLGQGGGNQVVWSRGFQVSYPPWGSSCPDSAPECAENSSSNSQGQIRGARVALEDLGCEKCMVLCSAFFYRHMWKSDPSHPWLKGWAWSIGSLYFLQPLLTICEGEEPLVSREPKKKSEIGAPRGEKYIKWQ